MLSVIIPAHNEEAWIGPCLQALVDQSTAAPTGVEIIVAANSCSDATVDVAHSYRAKIEARGWHLNVLDLPRGGKTGALNEAEQTATGDQRLFLDADVICSAGVLEQIAKVLDTPEPVFASGKFIVTPPQSWITRHYARLWTSLPFMTTGVPGGGLFAVNAAGRARWGAFPAVIADDSFARLQFAPSERIGVPAEYVTPLAEGFSALVRVRRRWDAGSRELQEKHPELMANDDKLPLGLGGHARLFFGQPISYLVYVTVSLTVRLGTRQNSPGWARGR